MLVAVESHAGAKVKSASAAAVGCLEEQQRGPELPADALYSRAAATRLCPPHQYNNALRRRLLPLNRSPFNPMQFQPLLPTATAKHRDKPLLVLDLDETLLHASLVSESVVATSAGGRPAVPLTVASKQAAADCLANRGSVEAYFVQFRPHLTAFLAFVVRRFELCFFTASTKAYATQVIGAMDSSVTRGAHRLFREHCADMDGKKIKDLSLLGRPLHRVVIVDNTEMSYHLQPRNGIPISSWYGDQNDRGLLDLLPLLDALSQSTNLVDTLDAHFTEHSNSATAAAVVPSAAAAASVTTSPNPLTLARNL